MKTSLQMLAFSLTIGAGLAQAQPFKQASLQERLAQHFEQHSSREAAVHDSLRALVGNKKLLGALRKSGEVIELGELKRGVTAKPRAVWTKLVTDSRGDFLNRTFSVDDHVHHSSKLVLTGEGLEVRHQAATASVTKASIAAFQQDLDRQFDGRGGFGFYNPTLKQPSVTLERHAPGPTYSNGKTAVRVGGLFGLREKLDIAAWRDLALAAVDRAVDHWMNK